MGDVVLLPTVVAFFWLGVAYVRGCAAVVGPGVGEPPPLLPADDQAEGAS